MKAIQDTAIKLARCQRCEAYVWLCNTLGMRTAVDPLPLRDLAAVMAVLSLPRSVYEVAYRANEPHHLRWLGGPGTTWDPGTRTLVAAHACSASAATAVEIPQEAPQVGVCQLWSAQGWSPPASCPRRGADGRTGLLFGDTRAPESCQACEAPPFDLGAPCGTANTAESHSREAKQMRSTAAPNASSTPTMHAGSKSLKQPSASKQSGAPATRTKPLACNKCGKHISDTEWDYIAIEHYRYTWAEHAYNCTPEREWKTRPHTHTAGQPGVDVEMQLIREHGGKNLERGITNVIEDL